MESPEHRGRIQAQGSGCEKSRSWAQNEPLTAIGMLAMCDELEAELSPAERRDRAECFEELRRYIRNAAGHGGLFAPASKSFLKRGARHIRVDLEVHRGEACAAEKP